MNTPKCSLCESGREKRIAEENAFSIYRCRDCGLVYVFPQPGVRALKDCYSESRFDRDEDTWKRFSRDVFRQAAGRISASRPPGRLLDAGCGYGFFMDLMKERGWIVKGLEIDAAAARHARETLGLDVHTVDLLSFDPGDERFDLITLWWVLEHIPDPLEALKRCAGFLKDEGMLIIRVPNINFIIFIHHFRFIEKLLTGIGISLSGFINPVSRKKGFFEILGPPYHLFGYNRHTIAAFLRKSGSFDTDIVLGGKLRTGKKLRDILDTLLYAIAAACSRLSRGRIILYPDMTVYAKKRV